jgi:hypothetical protein
MGHQNATTFKKGTLQRALSEVFKIIRLSRTSVPDRASREF